MSNASTNSSSESFTSATTSLDPEPRPPGKQPTGDGVVPNIDEQVSTITQITNKTGVKENTKYFVVAASWLTRVVSRTTQGQHEGHDKEFREGEIGPIDNSSIVRNGEREHEISFLTTGLICVN